MPELPEVETIVREMRPAVQGRVLREMAVLDSSAFSLSPLAPEQVKGLEVLSVRRRGKYILMDLGSFCIAIHLRMTGQLRWGEPDPRSRVIFRFSDGSQTLSFVDVRRLGKVLIFNTEDMSKVLSLGQEPLECGCDQFLEGLRQRRGRIKPLLMNQGFVAGLGNIYVTEALFASRIKPTRRASDLTQREGRQLFQAIQNCLKMGIQNGGSSFRNYVDLYGNPGRTQKKWRVYAKPAGSACPRCTQKLRFVMMAQRGTVYCPKCQK